MLLAGFEDHQNAGALPAAFSIADLAS